MELMKNVLLDSKAPGILPKETTRIADYDMISGRHTLRVPRDRLFFRRSFAGTSRDFAESRLNHKIGVSVTRPS